MSTLRQDAKYQAVETFHSTKERTARRWELLKQHKYHITNLKDRPGFELGTYLLEYEIWNQ